MGEGGAFGGEGEGLSDDDAAAFGIALDTGFVDVLVGEGDIQFGSGSFELGEEGIATGGCIHGERGKGFTVGVFQGKDVSDGKAGEFLDGGAVVLVGIGFAFIGTGGKDSDTGGAFFNEAVEFTPGVESGDAGGMGTLEGDEDLVGPGVVMELGHGVEPGEEGVALAGGIGFIGEGIEVSGNLLGKSEGFFVVHDEGLLLNGGVRAAQERGSWRKSRPERSGVPLGLDRQLGWRDSSKQAFLISKENCSLSVLEGEQKAMGMKGSLDSCW